jgi:serine/threonine-protein kinase HipA
VTQALRVDLGDIAVGTLTPVPTYPDRWRFRFLQEYRERSPRPILGQSFEDDLDRDYVSTIQLPEFFSNLLPEGALRDLIAKRAGVDPLREAELLRLLGEDLPGAIVVRPHQEDATLDASGEDGASVSPEPPSPNGAAPLKFSLAGVQLKFSAFLRHHKFTLPAEGRGGHWILKLPDDRFAGVPENEFSMLTWAARAGIEVPEHSLVDLAEVEGLPAEIGELAGQRCLAVRRYDRKEGGARVHQEDFAQILGLYGRAKYGHASHENIGAILNALGGTAMLHQYVDRLTFVVLSGNADAHVKNWSLYYPDPEGRRAELAPAYDQVCTLTYPGDSTTLALKLGKETRFDRMSPASFHRLARKCGVVEESLADRASAAAARIREAFREVERDLSLPDDIRAALGHHLDRIRL